MAIPTRIECKRQTVYSDNSVIEDSIAVFVNGKLEIKIPMGLAIQFWSEFNKALGVTNKELTPNKEM